MLLSYGYGNSESWFIYLSVAGVYRRDRGFGVVIGLANIRADLNYQQGMHRMWSRRTRYDFYFPAFANLGEQAIELREIYAQGTKADTTVFGYQERYAEYRYKPSQITGKFRSSITGGNLDVWHLSQFFNNAPTLNEEFIMENPPIERIIAVPSEPELQLVLVGGCSCYWLVVAVGTGWW